MSESKRSFFSSIPGLVTGIAGLLTGVVGLVTVLIQLDVIGGDDGGSPTAASGVTTTVAGQPAPATGGTLTTVSGRLTVQPAPLKLQPTEKEKAVTIRNETTATVTLRKPSFTGENPTVFSTDTSCTNVALSPGESCTVKVTLAPSGPLRTYKANLVIGAAGLPGVTEVPVEATTIL